MSCLMIANSIQWQAKHDPAPGLARNAGRLTQNAELVEVAVLHRCVTGFSLKQSPEVMGVIKAKIVGNFAY